MTRIVTTEDIINANLLGRRHCREDRDEFGQEAVAAILDDVFEQHDPMEVVLTVTGEKDTDEPDLILTAYEKGYDDEFYGD